MKKRMPKFCQICNEKFDDRDLYPIHLIRNNVLKVARKKYPNLDKDGYVCFADLRVIGALRSEEILREEMGDLSELEMEVLDSLKKQEILSDNINEQFEEGLTLGERLADGIAKFGGSWTFILFFGIVLFSWMGLNTLEFIKHTFDPYPFIFLNLILSCLAAIQAPVIMMSQNRHADKDRLTQENNYQINLKSELEIRQLNARLDQFMKHYWQTMDEITASQHDIVQNLEKKWK